MIPEDTSQVHDESRSRVLFVRYASRRWIDQGLLNRTKKVLRRRAAKDSQLPKPDDGGDDEPGRTTGPTALVAVG